MILKDARDAILTLLTTDAAFVAAVTALLGVAVSTGIKANRPLSEIPSGTWPCWVLELGDTTSAAISNDEYGAQTIGLSQQTFTTEFNIALVWADNDRDRAADARAELPVLLTQLFLANSMPGNIDGVTVTKFQPDRGGNHPTQIWRATLEADVTFMRDA